MMWLFRYLFSVLCSVQLVLRIVGQDQAGQQEKYSNFQCIGGSQAMVTEHMQHSHKKYPLNDVATRTCLFQNVCSVNGQLTYYKNPALNNPAANDYFPDSFKGNMFNVGHLRANTLPFHTVDHHIPVDYKFHNVKFVFLDANSWSYNYGHYIIDNVLAAFTAARVFNIPFVGSQQLLETYCGQFSTLEPHFADRLVDYNRSMGTYREACLAKFEGLRAHFFDHSPLYLDKMKNEQRCYRYLMVGHGSTFGLTSMDLSRAVMMREFRDFVVNRIQPPPPLQENLILVGLRTVGTAGGALLPNLCKLVTESAAKYPEFKVVCITPTDLSFEEELYYVNRAKILISAHGTISYMSMFARDGTVQLSICSPTEAKENHVLLWATHYQTLYMSWDHMHNLPSVLAVAIDKSNHFHNGNVV